VNKVPVTNNREHWDRSVYKASEEYKGRMVSYCGKAAVAAVLNDCMLSLKS